MRSGGDGLGRGLRGLLWGAAVTLLWTGLAAPASGQALFTRQETYSTPQGAYGIAAADFDADGWLDLAVTNQSTEHNNALGLTVYYNLAGAGFGGRQDYTTGYRPFGITAADFNRDGLPDLAVATYYRKCISIWYALPGRGFTARQDHAVDGQPWSVATGDFNQDGCLDLATNHYRISVLSGLPAGGFGSPQVLTTGTVGYGNLLAVDLDRDGFLDLALTTGAGGAVQVFRGRSGGAFGPSELYPIGPDADGLASGDLNGDGLIDLAAANWSAGKVTTLFGQADGGFGSPHEYALGLWTQHLAAGDFNLDGLLDLAITRRIHLLGYVTVLYGQGAGLLGDREDIQVGSNAHDIVAADFNRDGGLDLAVTDGTYSFTVLYNRLPEPATLALVAAGLGGLLAGRRRRS